VILAARNRNLLLSLKRVELHPSIVLFENSSILNVGSCWVIGIDSLIKNCGSFVGFVSRVGHWCLNSCPTDGGSLGGLWFRDAEGSSFLERICLVQLVWSFWRHELTIEGLAWLVARSLSIKIARSNFSVLLLIDQCNIKAIDICWHLLRKQTIPVGSHVFHKSFATFILNWS